MALLLGTETMLAPRQLLAQGASAYARAGLALQVDTLRRQLDNMTPRPAAFTTYRDTSAVGKRVFAFLDAPLDSKKLDSIPEQAHLDDVHKALIRIISDESNRTADQLSLKEHLNAAAAASLKQRNKVLEFAQQSISLAIAPAVGPSSAAAPALIGLPTDATLIVGATDFFVNRAKDELVYAYLARMKYAIDSSTSGPILGAVLPDTRTVLDNLGTSDARAVLPTLSASLRSDANGAPSRLMRVLALRESQTSTRNFLEVAAISFDALHDIREGSHPLDVLASLRYLSTADLPDANLRSALRFGGALVGEYRLGGDSLMKGIRNDRTRTLLAAFIARDLFAVTPSIDRQAFAGWVGVFGERYQNEVGPFVQSLQQADSVVKSARAKVDTTAPIVQQRAAYIAAYRAYLRPAELARRFAGEQEQPGMDKLLHVTNLAIDITEALAMKEYNRALITTFSGLRDFGPVSLPSPTVFRYLSFAATIAEADSASQVTAALNAAAMPVGSYRSKRGLTEDKTLNFGVTLNGYVGASAGREHIDANVPHSVGGQVGLAIPVGFEFALGGLKLGKTLVPSVALFVPIVDLGTIASARLASNDTAVATPAPTWSQVIAPGAYAIVGLTNHPIAFGIGWQMTHGARKNAETSRRLDASRVSALIAIDVPVFRF